jgi:hypothetical protein
MAANGPGPMLAISTILMPRRGPDAVKEVLPVTSLIGEGKYPDGFRGKNVRNDGVTVDQISAVVGHGVVDRIGQRP